MPLTDRMAADFAGLFARLAARPGRLLAFCFAANAVCQPYAGIYHDAELYAAQVAHAGTGRFADDLFFRYGSQSDYTVVPMILGFPTRWVGVEPVLLAAYLVANAARLWATQALTFSLMGRTPAAAAGLLLGAVTSVPLGCEDVFLTNEPFFTARVPAFGACLFALERVLAGRFCVAAVLFAVGAVMHPLVAAPASAVALGCAVWGWAVSPLRWTLLGAVLASAGAVAAMYLVATSGTLDAEWRGLVLANNYHVDPLNWPTSDWVRLVVAPTAALVLPWPDTVRRRFVVLVGVVAASGLLAAIAATHGTWALPFQVQAYRAVWPLEVLRLPLGTAAVGHLWANGGATGRTASAGLLVVLLTGPDLFVQRSVLVLAVGVGAMSLAILTTSAAETKNGLCGPVVAGLVAWGVVWYGAVVVPKFVAVLNTEAFARLQWPAPLHVARGYFGPFPRAAVGFAVVNGCVLLTRRYPRLACALAAGIGVAVPIEIHRAASGTLTARRSPLYAQAAFIRDVLAERWHGNRPPTVYWPAHTVRSVWFDVGANAYFHPSQMAGNIFARDLAFESVRRQQLVRPFETDRYRRDIGPDAAIIGMAGAADIPSPTLEHFYTLVAEPGLDFAVLPLDFGRWIATDGQVYVYDCRELRGPPAASDGDVR